MLKILMMPTELCRMQGTEGEEREKEKERDKERQREK